MTGQVVTLKAGGHIAGIIPQSIEEVFRLSQGIAASGLAPKDMNTAEKITVAILTGLEIGLPPMFALQKIAVVNGRPCLWGDALPALLWSRGFKLREWTDGDTAHCEVTRPDGEKIVRTFSDADAKAAGLLGKSGPWQQFKPRMRQMRARGYACRDGAADVLSGLYLREELDEPTRDVTPAKPSLEIPDVPDAAEVHTTPASDAEIPEPIADAEGFLSKLGDDLALCETADELTEIADSNASVIARLSQEHRNRAEAMLAEAGE